LVGRIKEIFSALHVTEKEGHTNTFATCPVKVKTKDKTLKLMPEVLLRQMFYSV
jgi:hypothetical protein